MSNTSLKDNRPSRGSVADFLKAEIIEGTELSFVSAYFTVNAYAALRHELESADHLRFLFGEPAFITGIANKQKAPPTKIQSTGLSSEALQLSSNAKACSEWISKMVAIRSIVRPGFLHGKAYHIKNINASKAILGSSNFTVPGLGLHPDGGNIELNIVVDSDRDKEELLAWFDEVWNDTNLTKDVKEEVLTYLSRIYDHHSPQFIYFLTLYHLFGEELDKDEQTDEALKKTSLLESSIWERLFSFQKDGVKGMLSKLRDFGGCILADSVGLGKTFEALAVIKAYTSLNKNVLVLCPKKLRQNWDVYRADHRLCPFPEDKLDYRLMSHTDLGRTSGEADGRSLADFRWEAYDLIVIDESHNFRNNKVGKPDDEGNIKRPRYQVLMEDIIQAGGKTRVLLLSATPVNNGISDLRNQISLIAGGDVTREPIPYDHTFSETLGVTSIKDTCKNAQSKFTTWTKKPAEDRKAKDLIHELGSDFFRLLDGLSIARSRSQIKRYYSHELETLGGFPKRKKPQSEYPDIDTKQEFLSFEKIDDLIGNLNLSLYHPTHSLKKDLPPEILEAYQHKIGNFTQEGREKILISMMKVNFLKRLESSIHSFRKTIQNTINKADNLIKQISTFQSLDNANDEVDFGDISDELLEELEIEREDLEIGAKKKINLAHIDLPNWKAAISNDRTELQVLLDYSIPVTAKRDAKLLRVRELVDQKVNSPTLNKDDEPIRKVIIFTAFADTARYLYEELAKPVHQTHSIHTALVAGGNNYETTLGTRDYNEILTHFSPRSKDRNLQTRLEQNEEIDLLIATDCISEGQNLQDCDLLINYDIHWNPVRIIQRFGRIDRIGSRHHHISLVNFWPTRDLDRYINVKNRVESRMALVDLTATGEDNLLNTEKIDDHIKHDLNYRNRQLKKLQSEILELDELQEEEISLASFSMNDFRLDLSNYLQSHQAELESSPTGLFAVVPTREEIPMAKPGVIFCLKHKAEVGENLVNPLSPHFLVYIHNDGNVRLTFAQPKQTLELFKALAMNHSEALADLCDIFDQRTANNSNMEQENILLERCVESIKATFKRRAGANLFSGRSGTLPTQSQTPESKDDFELVTWLVIQDSQ